MNESLPFSLESVISRLEVFPEALRATVTIVPEQLHAWRPGEGYWSVLEILAHLALEEEQDFRPRIACILAEPQKPWPPIDPEGAVASSHANSKPASHWLDRFENERAESVAWLRSLDCPDLDRANVHPKFGAMPARGLLGAWTAHDALHLRQILKRLYQIARREAGEYEVGYAGSWAERG